MSEKICCVIKMHAVCNLQAINWESIVCQILIIYFNMTHITNVQIFIFSGVSISKKNVVSQAEKGWSSNFKKERCLHSLKKCKDDLGAIIIHETPHWVSGNIFSKSKLSGCAVHFQCFICWASTFYRKVITIERLISQKSKSADTDYRPKLPIKSAD